MEENVANKLYNIFFVNWKFIMIDVTVLFAIFYILNLLLRIIIAVLDEVKDCLDIPVRLY